PAAALRGRSDSRSRRGRSRPPPQGCAGSGTPPRSSPPPACCPRSTLLPPSVHQRVTARTVTLSSEPAGVTSLRSRRPDGQVLGPGVLRLPAERLLGLRRADECLTSIHAAELGKEVRPETLDQAATVFQGQGVGGVDEVVVVGREVAGESG